MLEWLDGSVVKRSSRIVLGSGLALAENSDGLFTLSSGIGSYTLNDLQDVVIGTPATGEYITYNGTYWVDSTYTLGLGGNVSTGGAVTFSGAYAFTGTLTNTTSVTFPTSGTLVNTAVTTLSSLVSIGTITTGVWNAGSVTSSSTISATTYVNATTYFRNSTGRARTDPTTPLEFYYDTTNTVMRITGYDASTARGWVFANKAGAGSETTQFAISNAGAVTTGSWTGSVVAGQYGGTGVANTGKTITVSGNTSIGSSTDTVTFTTSGATSVALPTTGTLVNTAVTSLSSLATVGTITSGVWNAGAVTSSSTISATTYVNATTYFSNSTGRAQTAPTNPFEIYYDTTNTVMRFTGYDGTTARGWVFANKQGAGSETTQFAISAAGAVTTGSWTGSVVAGQYGGTGVANTGKTITVSGNTSIGSSTDTVTFTTSGATSVALPTSGTLVNTAVTSLSSLATVGTITSGTWNAGSVTSSTFLSGTTYVEATTYFTNKTGRAKTAPANPFEWYYDTTNTVMRVAGYDGTTARGWVWSNKQGANAETDRFAISSTGAVTTGSWTATIVGLAYGGTNANLSATGPGFLKQASGGANVTVAAITAADVAAGSFPSGTFTFQGVVNFVGGSFSGTDAYLAINGVTDHTLATNDNGIGENQGNLQLMARGSVYAYLATNDADTSYNFAVIKKGGATVFEVSNPSTGTNSTRSWIRYDGSNYVQTSVSSAGYITYTVAGSTGGFSFAGTSLANGITENMTLTASSAATRAFTTVSTHVAAADNDGLNGYVVSSGSSVTAAAFAGISYSGFVYASPTVNSGTIVNEYGMFINALTRGTNKYAIYTGGAGMVRIADRMSIGANGPSTDVGLNFGGALSSGFTGTLQRGVVIDFSSTSAATGGGSRAGALDVRAQTAAAAYTVDSLSGLYVFDAVKGSTSAITNQYGVYVASQTQGGTNYAIYTNTGLVRFGDVVAIGTTPNASYGLMVYGSRSANGAQWIRLGGTTTATANNDTFYGFTASSSVTIASSTYTGVSYSGYVYASPAVTGTPGLASEYGLNVGAPSIATTSRYGLYVGNVSGASTNNYAIYTNTGPTRLGDRLIVQAGTLPSSAGNEQYGAIITQTYNTAETGHKQGLRIGSTIAHTTGTLQATSTALLLAVVNGSGGTSTDVHGLYSRIDVNTGATATSVYNIHVISPSGTQGTIGTYYGIKVEDVPSWASTKYALYTGTGAVRFGGDLTLATLGVLDSTTAPTGADPSGSWGKILSYNTTNAKWQPRTIQTTFVSGDVGTSAVTYGQVAMVAAQSKTQSAAGQGAPTVTLTAQYKAILVDMGAAPPSGMNWEVWQSTDNVNFYSMGETQAQRVVNAGLTLGQTYYYKARAAGSASSYGSYNTAVSVAPSNVAESNAFGIILASQIATTTLSSIAANIGTVTAGIVRDANSKFVADLTNALLTVNDGTYDRVKIGKIGSDYGIKVVDAANKTAIDFTGTNRIMAVPVTSSTDSGSAKTITLSSGLTHQVRITASPWTLTLSGATDGARYRIWFQQDTAGSRPWPSVITDENGADIVMYTNEAQPSLTSTPGAMDLYEFEYRASPTARFTCIPIQTNVLLPTPQFQEQTPTQDSTFNASHAINMPATVAAGDLLIMLYSHDVNNTVNTPSTWTKLVDTAAGIGDKFYVFAKASTDGSEAGGTVTVTLTSGTSRCAAQVLRYKRWYGSVTGGTYAGVEVGTSTTGSGTTPNPPSLTPNSTDRRAWIAMYSVSGTRSTSGWPANYTSIGTLTDGSGGTGVTNACARRTVYDSSQDPGTFTINSTASWVTNTLSIRPPG